MRKSEKDASRIAWTVDGLDDLVLNLGVLPTELSITNLTGKGKGGKGSPCPSVPDAPNVVVTWRTLAGH